MATSDGISNSDWDKIQLCAEEIVSASANGADCILLNSNMDSILSQLKSKYGRLPSLLATEADYVEDQQEELSLLKEAYVSACEIQDVKNVAFIAASIAEYYLDNDADFSKILFWRDRLKESLTSFQELYLESVLSDLTDEINRRDKK